MVDIDWGSLIPVDAGDLAAAISGLLTNSVVGTGLLVVLGAVLAPRVVGLLFKIFGRR